jgi:hypothetical protein
MDAVADAWQADLAAESGFYAFNDFHGRHVLRPDRAGCADREPAPHDGGCVVEKLANGEMTREVGIDLCEAVYKFGNGRYAEAADTFVAALDTAWKFGGQPRAARHPHRSRSSRRRAAPAAGASRSITLPSASWHKPAGQWGRRIAARI